MSTRTIFLIIYPGQSNQRSYFGIWVPYQEGDDEGTVIHIVGALMAGFSLEFKRKYNPKETVRVTQLVPIGSVHVQHVHNFQGARGKDNTRAVTLNWWRHRLHHPGPALIFWHQ
jgi:hypothetical protein